MRSVVAGFALLAAVLSVSLAAGPRDRQPGLQQVALSTPAGRASHSAVRKHRPAPHRSHPARRHRKPRPMASHLPRPKQSSTPVTSTSATTSAATSTSAAATSTTTAAPSTTSAATSTAATTSASSTTIAPMTSPSFGYGVYAGPDSKGVTGAADFDSQMGTTSTHVLDFTPTNDWSQIEGQSWLLQPHAGQLARLELSIPVVPSITGASLSACAQGQYNSHWTALGRNLVYYGLANTIVRPGWEFNGNWYAWSAASQPATFAECFRQVVTTMRAVTGARFAFDWNVANGPQAFDATLAWPGASYVDYVGVDVYDTSWVHYSSTSPITSAQQAATINDLINGKYGLAFWANFAQQQGRPMAVTEWGVTWRSDGHGGGDDPSFVDAMFSFFADSTHNVAYEDYFNTASSTTDHVLTGLTRFPLSAAEFKAKVAAG